MEKQNRFKSWALWVSVLGSIWVIMSAFGVTEKLGISEGTFKSITDSIGAILIAFGVLNNPSDPENF